MSLSFECFAFCAILNSIRDPMLKIKNDLSEASFYESVPENEKEQKSSSLSKVLQIFCPGEVPFILNLSEILEV